MAKVPGFAKVYAGRWAHRRNGHQATFANAAGFFNNLLAESRGSDDPGLLYLRYETRRAPAASPDCRHLGTPTSMAMATCSSSIWSATPSA